MNEKLSLLRRFFKNRYSQNDYLELKEMVHSNKYDLEKFMQQHWDEFKPETKSNKNLNKILKRINQDSGNELQANSIKKLSITFSRIAAILVIPLMIALGYLYLEFNEYLSQKDVYVELTSPVGGRTSINLPDGSTVWLNGESRIRYPAVFNENRKVEVSGEVFFKVKSDVENPFLVGAKDVFVKATGTEFNVLAYDDNPEINVILKEGKVNLIDNSHKHLKKMQPGYRLKFNNETQSLKYSKINAEDYSQWIYGKLIFHETPFSEVVSRMERWYGVDIEVADKELYALHFKATFEEEGIEEALKLLQYTATFNYRFEKREIKEDGSYKQAKIYITKK